MAYNEPVHTLATSGVVLASASPTSLFASRSVGNNGWQMANNTGVGVWVYEAKSGEAAPTQAQMIAAGTLFGSGAGIEGGSRTGTVYAMLASGGLATVYPQELSL